MRRSRLGRESAKSFESATTQSQIVCVRSIADSAMLHALNRPTSLVYPRKRTFVASGDPEAARLKLRAHAIAFVCRSDMLAPGRPRRQGIAHGRPPSQTR